MMTETTPDQSLFILREIVFTAIIILYIIRFSYTTTVFTAAKVRSSLPSMAVLEATSENCINVITLFFVLFFVYVILFHITPKEHLLVVNTKEVNNNAAVKDYVENAKITNEDTVKVVLMVDNQNLVKGLAEKFKFKTELFSKIQSQKEFTEEQTLILWAKMNKETISDYETITIINPNNSYERLSPKILLNKIALNEKAKTNEKLLFGGRDASNWER